MFPFLLVKLLPLRLMLSWYNTFFLLITCISQLPKHSCLLTETAPVDSFLLPSPEGYWASMPTKMSYPTSQSLVPWPPVTSSSSTQTPTCFFPVPCHHQKHSFPEITDSKILLLSQPDIFLVLCSRTLWNILTSFRLLTHWPCPFLYSPPSTFINSLSSLDVLVHHYNLSPLVIFIPLVRIQILLLHL